MSSVPKIIFSSKTNLTRLTALDEEVIRGIKKLNLRSAWKSINHAIQFKNIFESANVTNLQKLWKPDLVNFIIFQCWSHSSKLVLQIVTHFFSNKRRWQYHAENYTKTLNLLKKQYLDFFSNMLAIFHTVTRSVMVKLFSSNG